jgi:hypothetical protein
MADGKNNGAMMLAFIALVIALIALAAFGVSSLNGLTGDIKITSSNSNIIVNTISQNVVLTGSGGGGGTPAPPFNSIQFNSNGAFGGNSILTYNQSNLTVHSGNAILSMNLSYPDYYLPVNVLNSQSTNTPSPFQLLIPFNSLKFQSHEASNLGNIRFYSNVVMNPTNELFSWCESNCTSSAVNTLFWVRIPTNIIVGNTIIYINFTPTINNYDGNHAGEAPQLTTSYGQFDNGGHVFTFYDNFSTSAQLVGWRTGAGTAIASSGLTVSCTSGASSFGICGVAYGTSNFVQPYVEESLMQVVSGGSPLFSFGMISGSNVPSATTNQFNPSFWIDVRDNLLGDGYYNGATNLGGSPPALTAGYKIMQIAAQGSNDLTLTAYTTIYTRLYTITKTNWNQQAGYIALGGTNTGDGGNSYWVRVRTLPPNSIMPTTTFGSVVSNGNVLVTTGGSLFSGNIINSRTTQTTDIIVTNNSGTANYVLTSTSSGLGLWRPTTTISPTLPTPPAGSDQQIQYNNMGSFGANPNFLMNYVNLTMTIGDPSGGFYNGGNLTVDSNVTAGNLTSETNLTVVNKIFAPSSVIAPITNAGGQFGITLSSPNSNGYLNSTEFRIFNSSLMVANSANAKAATTALATVCSNIPASLGTYQITGYLTVNTLTTDVAQMQTQYKNERNNIITQTMPMTSSSGATAASISSVGTYSSASFTIRANTITPIVVNTILTTSIGSINYDVGCTITRLSS